jgi:hypothetical protein
MSQGTAPVARALARIAAARDAARLASHEDAKRYGWIVEYDGDVLVTVTLTARAAHYQPEQFDTYVVTHNCDSYDLWPPETKFVNPTTRTYVIGQDVSTLPKITDFPNLGIHPVFTSFYDRARVDQLICFSFTRGYYDTGHQALPHEKWTPGRHWLFSTVMVLHRALQPPFYQGRME